MANSWIDYVKSYAADKGISYKAALATKGLNEEYRKSNPPKEKKMKSAEPEK